MSDPADVRSHVWESLLSMLQVYAHAAGLNGNPYLVTTCSNVASVQHEHSVLTLHFSPDTGEGSWLVTHPEREECGAFRIDEHGALTDPVGPKEIDQAAIDWIGYLGRTNEESATPLAPTIHPSPEGTAESSPGRSPG
jgi:hypothetical protein